jgi:hypothetical protein
VRGWRIIGGAAGAAIAIGLCAGVYWWTIDHSLSGLEAGLQQADVLALNKYIDWQQMRTEAREQLVVQATERQLSL